MSQTTVLLALAAGLVGVNTLLLVLGSTNVKTIELLRKERINLEQEERTIQSVKVIGSQYRESADLIASVFPTETTIPTLIETLESVASTNSDQYTVKFSAVTPVKEQGRLFLPVSISIKTDFDRLTNLLGFLERVPYMARLTSVIIKTPEGFTGKNEVQIGLKVYVNDPFSE